MKKLVILFAVAMMAVSAQAQTVTESKTFDNFYVGINGGLATKATGHKWMNGLDPNAGLRIGRWFTPVSYTSEPPQSCNRRRTSGERGDHPFPLCGQQA